MTLLLLLALFPGYTREICVFSVVTSLFLMFTVMAMFDRS